MAMRASDAELRLRLAKGLWNWAPHPTQREWLLSEAQTKVAACGRRWGKTEAAAIDASTMALARPGSVQMIVSPTYDQSRLIFSTVERLLLASPATRPLVKVIKTPHPRLTVLGSIISARTADEDGRNLRGHAADRVIVDEAAYVRESVITEVISPMLADRDGRLVMISTPFGKNHFYRAFQRGSGEGSKRENPKGEKARKGGRESHHGNTEGEETQKRGKETVPCFSSFSGSVIDPGPRCEAFTFPSWANPHISAAYIEQQRRELSPRQFSVEYEAAFIDDQSCVFAWEEIERAAGGYRGQVTGDSDRIPATGFECVVAGIDWARYTDYTALVAVGVSERGCEVVGIDRFNNIGWSLQIERVVEFLKRHHASAALTDQTSIGDPLLEQLKSRLWEAGADVSVEGFTFTNQSKRELVDHLALLFARGEIGIPSDEQLTRELQYYEYELTESGNVRLGARGGCHDDLVMALALACRQAKSMGVSGAYLSRNGRVAAAGW